MRLNCRPGSMRSYTSPRSTATLAMLHATTSKIVPMTLIKEPICGMSASKAITIKTGKSQTMQMTVAMRPYLIRLLMEPVLRVRPRFRPQEASFAQSNKYP